MLPYLPDNWKNVIGPPASERLSSLTHFLRQEKAAGKTVFPSEDNIFRALALTGLNQVKVVILGQDPYHGEQQAHGLSFSVPAGTKLPPSLRNIYKELASDLGVKPPVSGDLSRWAEQGVLLLNAVLTVESGLAGSHAGKGWEEVTDALIKAVSDQRRGVVFILWGNYALKKRTLIDESKHLVITSAHPSPLSASRGFFGSRPFSQANAWLQSTGQTPIDWET
jgi:uracil-DNA glycosylase